MTSDRQTLYDVTQMPFDLTQTPSDLTHVSSQVLSMGWGPEVGGPGDAGRDLILRQGSE